MNGRELDVDIATTVLGRLVVFDRNSDRVVMTENGKTISLPKFSQDLKWQDDIVFSIMEERSTEVFVKFTDEGYAARFVHMDDDAEYEVADTEHKALCLAAVAYRAKYARKRRIK